jgi:hypothetical protein
MPGAAPVNVNMATATSVDMKIAALRTAIRFAVIQSPLQGLDKPATRREARE